MQREIRLRSLENARQDAAQAHAQSTHCQMQMDQCTVALRQELEQEHRRVVMCVEQVAELNSTLASQQSLQTRLPLPVTQQQPTHPVFYQMPCTGAAANILQPPAPVPTISTVPSRPVYECTSVPDSPVGSPFASPQQASPPIQADCPRTPPQCNGTTMPPPSPYRAAQSGNSATLDPNFLYAASSQPCAQQGPQRYNLSPLAGTLPPQRETHGATSHSDNACWSQYHPPTRQPATRWCDNSGNLSLQRQTTLPHLPLGHPGNQFGPPQRMPGRATNARPTASNTGPGIWGHAPPPKMAPPMPRDDGDPDAWAHLDPNINYAISTKTMHFTLEPQPNVMTWKRWNVDTRRKVVNAFPHDQTLAMSWYAEIELAP